MQRYKVKRTYGTLGKTFRDVFGTFGAWQMDPPIWIAGSPGDPGYPGHYSWTEEEEKDMDPPDKGVGKKRPLSKRRTRPRYKIRKGRSRTRTKPGKKRSGVSDAAVSGLWYMAKKRGVKRLRVRSKYGKKKKVKFL